MNISETTLKEFSLMTAAEKKPKTMVNSGSGERKRKIDEDTAEAMQREEQLPQKRTLLPSPPSQPTHTGYLTCAKLLPFFDETSDT